jgi:hypothetical protein
MAQVCYLLTYIFVCGNGECPLLRNVSEIIPDYKVPHPRRHLHISTAPRFKRRDLCIRNHILLFLAFSTKDGEENGRHVKVPNLQFVAVGDLNLCICTKTALSDQTMRQRRL